MNQDTLPNDSRTLLKTDQKATLVWEILLKRLWQKTIIATEKLPLFKSRSLQLWPILIRFSSFKPAPAALYCGYKKPDIAEYLVEFVDEMEKLHSEPLVVNGSSYELSIYTFTCDAPARALLKGIVQHTVKDAQWKEQVSEVV